MTSLGPYYSILEEKSIEEVGGMGGNQGDTLPLLCYGKDDGGRHCEFPLQYPLLSLLLLLLFFRATGHPT